LLSSFFFVSGVFSFFWVVSCSSAAGSDGKGFIIGILILGRAAGALLKDGGACSVFNWSIGFIGKFKVGIVTAGGGYKVLG